MKVELKPFLALLRKASKCKYSSVFQMNHIWMQCYTVDIDSDIGFHYVLYVPKTDPAYMSPFYDINIEIPINTVLKTYTEGHKELTELKKSNNWKPKDIKEELYVQEQNGFIEFKFLFYGNESIVSTKTCQTVYPLDPTIPKVENITNTIMYLMERIKVGGTAVLLDGKRLGFVDHMVNDSGMCYYTIKLNGKRLQIPLVRSMLSGNKSVDEMMVTIQESNLKNIYVMSYTIVKDGITEIYFGYLMSF